MEKANGTPNRHTAATQLTFIKHYLFFFFFFLFFFFGLYFRVVPEAYGGSQAKGQIGALAAGVRHSPQQHWILNPLSEARDQT